VTIQSSRDNFCIVRLLRAYISFAKKLHVDVTTGPLLRGVRTQKRLAAGPGILGSMPTTADIRSRMAALCKRAGIPRAALHALRRGGAKALRLEGASRQKVKDIGFWKSEAMAEHYADADKSWE
jgi:hypothetical protein